ncbi:uncharacterized protein V6R79_009760 [Siganus canaliculatus]
MDDFVRSKLTQWGLSELINDFEEQGINQESLYCLDDDDVANLIPKVGPRSIFKKRLNSLKEAGIPSNKELTELPGEEDEDASDSAQAEPSTSDTSYVGKRKSDFLGEPSKQLPNKKRCEMVGGSYTDNIILSDVKRIMAFVNDRLPKEDNKFIQFLKTKILDLETDKRELVGVFGKTGAGKSSLINAIIEEKKLLPSGDVNACTSVMIKVEANRKDHKYEAEIEFITKEEWKDELWSLLNFLGDNSEQDEDRDGDEKLTALYGDEWKDKSPETLMEFKYFKEIPEFLNSQKKFLRCETAKELSGKFTKYTRTESKVGDSKGVKKWYWPLVKCVTIRVPDSGLLQHVTLVDLPGNGDRNKSRDKMWKEVVGNCSTVWIVTEVNRAASEPEPWEILKSAASIMGNGGECQQIHFICTKTDNIDSDECSAGDKRTLIFKRNIRAKEKVTQEFNKLHKVMKHFSPDSFRVFTVSSREFQKKTHLSPDETEIPKLQEVLQDLNDWHSETLNYVSGARGILSLIQGARFREEGGRLTDVFRNLVENLVHDTNKVRREMIVVYGSFEKRLSEGAEKSKGSYEKLLHSFLYPTRVKGSAFHRVLKSVVANRGTHKPKKGKQKNLNAKLASCLTDCIDEEFKKTFPNDRAHGPFNGVIDSFSLGTEKLIHKYKDAELLLTFLKTEEDTIKTKLNKIIQNRKKIIYNSLTTTIEETMNNCYERAAQISGVNSLQNMRNIIQEHVHESKNIMFDKTKDEMLNLLRELMEDILKQLEETLLMSIELTLKTDGSSIPDLSVEFDMVKNYYNELMASQAAE